MWFGARVEPAGVKVSGLDETQASMTATRTGLARSTVGLVQPGVHELKERLRLASLPCALTPVQSVERGHAASSSHSRILR